MITLKCRSAMLWLAFLLRPEDSTQKTPLGPGFAMLAGKRGNANGIIKCLLWIGMAIATGLLIGKL